MYRAVDYLSHWRLAITLIKALYMSVTDELKTVKNKTFFWRLVNYKLLFLNVLY
jgi:hypothetical protein